MVLLAALLSYFYSRNITHTSGVSLSSLSLYPLLLHLLLSILRSSATATPDIIKYHAVSDTLP